MLSQTWSCPRPVGWLARAAAGYSARPPLARRASGVALPRRVLAGLRLASKSGSNRGWCRMINAPGFRFFDRRSAGVAVLWLLAGATVWHALRPLILHEHAGPAVILYHVLGASFAVCGLLALHRRPENPTGSLMVLTGFLFFVRPILISLHSSLADTVGLAIGNLWVVVFAVMLLGYPSGRRRWTTSDWLVIGVVAVAEVVLVVAWMLFFPYPSDLIAFWPNARVAADINEVAGIMGFGAALAVSALLGVRWRAATTAVRRASAPAAAGAVTLLFLAGLILQGAFTSEQSPLLVWPTLIGLTCVPVLFLVGLLRSWRARAAVSQLLIDIGAAPGKPLQAGLARALGDPTLTLAYWLPKFASYVDGDGAAVALPSPGSGRLVAVVEQDDERVAAIVYDAALADERELLEAVCAAAGYRPPERAPRGRAQGARQRSRSFENPSDRCQRYRAPPARAQPARRGAAAPGGALDAAALAHQPHPRRPGRGRSACRERPF